MKTRKSILMVLGLVLLLGGSYAFYTYQKYSGMQNLLNGEIYLNYLEDNEVHISGIFPETKEEALKRDDNTISFKVLSKNTSDKDIYYGITLNYGEEISNKVRIDAKYIMIYLECDGKVLIDGIRYSDFNNRRIYVDKIDAKTYTETTKNYILRFWVDEETTISDTDTNASYKDSEGNTAEEKSDTLDLTYLFTKNKTVEIQVFVHPNNDANGKTNVLLEIYKNKKLMQSFIKRVEVKGNNYCLNNNFNKLIDCMLVSDSLSESVDVAKTNISNKGEPNLNDTAPTYTYVEQISKDVSNPYSYNSIKFAFSKTYEFDETTGGFKLSGDVIVDYLSDKYIEYYTGGAYWDNSFDRIFYVKGIDVQETSQKITKADVITYKIASSIRSEVGLYKTVDNYGDVYYYRGDVQNNNVYFGGFYWKVIRTNGDGSIRLIYNGKNQNENYISINNKKYLYSNRHSDPTYVGYMYGENFKLQTSPVINYSYFYAVDTYTFADSYIFDEDKKMFVLSGNTISGTFSAIKDEVSKYPYSCFRQKLSNKNECQILLKINSYISSDKASVQLISYSSQSVDNTRTNDYDSNVKNEIDLWYEQNIMFNKDSYNNNLTDYIVDNSFCNDRSFASSVEYNSGYRVFERTNYAPLSRISINANKSATLKCNGDIRDMFSATSAYGNAKLKYPIALITVDEVVLAGGKSSYKNINYYLKSNNYFVTMTPSFYSEKNLLSSMFCVRENGSINQWCYVDILYSIKPVINIRSDVLISSGDGTMDSPYQLKLK